MSVNHDPNPERPGARPTDAAPSDSPTPLGREIGRREALRNIALGGISLVGLASGLAACGSSTAKSSGSSTGSKNTEAKVVYVRSLGGSYEAAWQEAAWKPFEKATGISVVGIASTPAALLASAQAGRATLDVIDLGEFATIKLAQAGILSPLALDQFKRTNPAVLTGPRASQYVASFAFSTVLGYDSRTYGRAGLSNWADFWDVRRYPGKRTLESLTAGNPNLEQALLADGVPMEKIFPIDIPRAFNKMAEIRSSIPTYWTTGAQSAELFTTGSVTAGAIWNGRLQVPINDGYPGAIQWNQGERLYQAFSIPKNAPHPENALAYIDFALQPEVLAKFAAGIYYGPTNKLSYKYIDSKVAALLPTSPEREAVSFPQDARWWVDNIAAVTTAWQQFLQ